MSQSSPTDLRVLVVMNPLPLHSGVGAVQLKKALDLIAGSCPQPVVVTANLNADDFPSATVFSYQHDARRAGLMGKLWRQVKSQFKMVLQCRAALRQCGPFDAVIFWVGTEQILAQLYMRLRRQRTLIYLYGTPQDIPGSGFLKRLIGNARHSMRNLTARLAWQVAVEAPGVNLPKSVKGKAVAIPLGLEIAPSIEGLQREDITLYAGRLASCKGLVELIRAAQDAGWPQGLKLVIAGDGPLAEQLQELAADTAHIEMVGWVNHQQLCTWMQRSRFVVLPSETEGLPNALMEGMAYGAIPVATAVGGIPTLTEDFRLGQLIAEVSTPAILDAIQEVSKRPDLKALAQDCKLSIAQRYSLPVSQLRMRKHLTASRHGNTLILSNLLPGMSEGQSNFAKHLQRELQAHHVPVKHRNLKSAILNPLLWFGLRRYRRIHVVFRYNQRLARFLRWLDLLTPGRVSLWALQPPLVKPRRHPALDSLFCLSQKTAKLFDETGLVPHLVRCGINPNQFAPRSSCNEKTRASIRQQFAVQDGQRWVIHVGPIRENRGIRNLAAVAASDAIVLTIISRPGSGEDPGLRQFLTAAGVRIHDQFIESIEALYHSADLMVFPTTDPSGCIELPLSVLEAMACQLPVIAAPFGGLVDAFPEGAAGLRLVAADADWAAEVADHSSEAGESVDLSSFHWETGLDTALAAIPSRRHKKGRLIMVTGLDGAGKSTLLAGLAEELRQQGHCVSVPWCGYEMKLLRPLVTFAKRVAGASPKRMESDYSGYRKAMVGAINRPFVGPIYRIMVGFEYFFQMLWKVRIPLWRGHVILADRYVHDICVAFAANSDEDQTTLNKRVRRWSRLVPTPDLKLFVDVPPEVSIQRKDDIPDLEYLTSRRNRYLAMAEASDFMALDGTLSREQVLNTAINAACAKD
ncbi:MAG: glycosyltransferase [Planctomycetes bacterium]|nr:glycosyltransferase [Planctomycetota bacterium]